MEPGVVTVAAGMPSGNPAGVQRAVGGTGMPAVLTETAIGALHSRFW